MRNYELILYLSGIDIRIGGERTPWEMELHREVSSAFGEALTRDGASIVIEFEIGDRHDVDHLVLNVDTVFVDVCDASMSPSEAFEVGVNVGIFAAPAVTKASSKDVIAWAKKLGWEVAEGLNLDTSVEN